VISNGNYLDIGITATSTNTGASTSPADDVRGPFERGPFERGPFERGSEVAEPQVCLGC
jgi:hypothetical protein